MSIGDEVRRIRQEKADRDRISAAWAASPFRKRDPRVGMPPPHFKPVLDEARSMLHYNKKVYIGKDPDGVTRVIPAYRRKLFFSIEERVWNARSVNIHLCWESDSDSHSPVYLQMFEGRPEIAPAELELYFQRRYQDYYLKQGKSGPEILAIRIAEHLTER